MTELSVAHRALLAQIVDRCPDEALSQLSLVVRTMSGARARALSELIATESRDRRRRRTALEPLVPMFARRADGVEAMTFPSQVLARLWKAASAREPHLLPVLDRDGPQATAVADRICQAAAAAVRDKPDLVWPGAGAERDAGLEELARCCDLAHLARRGLRTLPDWIGRPDGDQLAELRLLIRDSVDVAPDGARRLLEILFAHLPEAANLLRVVVQASAASGSEQFLAGSEMAVFVDRLIAAVEARVARIAAYRPGGEGSTQDELRAAVTWCAGVLNELDMTLHVQTDGAWGKKVRDARLRINRTLLAQLRNVERAVDKTLPTARVQLAGRMTRAVPATDAPLEAQTVEAAREHLALLGAIRGAATVIGCEGERQKLATELTARLAGHADSLLVLVNAGEAADEGVALDMVAMTAQFLTLVGAADEARTVRRRLAVAGLDRTSHAAA